MADQTLAKRVNARSILSLLRGRGPLSRAEIARSLGLTQATIGRLASEMMEQGLLRDAAGGPESQRDDTRRDPGRPGIALEIDPNGAHVIGIEIGVRDMRFVLLDLTLGIAEAEALTLATPPSPQEAAEAIGAQIARWRLPGRRIPGVGVTLPGLVTTSGHVITLPILGWRETDFRGLLARVTDLPVTIENNANAAAFAAVYAQPGLTPPLTVFLKLGTGCGGAAILGGRLLRGADGTALEPGHLKIAEDGPPCSCGQRGCLETFVNLAALAALHGEADPDAIAASIDAGEPRGRAVTAHLARHLGQGIAGLVNLFNPGQIVLGGALLPVLRRALPEIEAEVAARIIRGTRLPGITLSPLGPFECAIGAASLVHQAEFDLAALEVGFTPAR